VGDFSSKFCISKRNLLAREFSVIPKLRGPDALFLRRHGYLSWLITASSSLLHWRRTGGQFSLVDSGPSENFLVRRFSTKNAKKVPNPAFQRSLEAKLKFQASTVCF